MIERQPRANNRFWGAAFSRAASFVGAFDILWMALSGWQLRPRRGRLRGMTISPNPYRGFRFPPEVIQHAVWLYHYFTLSLRDVELILAARGIVVSYESIREWGLRFGRRFANMLKRRRPRPGDKWYMDEVFIRIRGRQHYLWRAICRCSGRRHSSWSSILTPPRRSASLYRHRSSPAPTRSSSETPRADAAAERRDDVRRVPSARSRRRCR
jgi:hypothetical protein